jgi:hypothetical protein
VFEDFFLLPFKTIISVTSIYGIFCSQLRRNSAWCNDFGILFFLFLQNFDCERRYACFSVYVPVYHRSVTFNIGRSRCRRSRSRSTSKNWFCSCQAYIHMIRNNSLVALPADQELRFELTLTVKSISSAGLSADSTMFSSTINTATGFTCFPQKSNPYICIIVLGG